MALISNCIVCCSFTCNTSLCADCQEIVLNMISEDYVLRHEITTRLNEKRNDDSKKRVRSLLSTNHNGGRLPFNLKRKTK